MYLMRSLVGGVKLVLDPAPLIMNDLSMFMVLCSSIPGFGCPSCQTTRTVFATCGLLMF